MSRASGTDVELVQTAGVPTIRIAQDPDADDLLGRDPLALLLGMLFDQHVSRGWSDPAR